MFARNGINKGNIRLINSVFRNDQSVVISCRSLPLRCYQTRRVKSFNIQRYFSSQNTGSKNTISSQNTGNKKNYFPLIVSLVGITGIGAVSYLKFSKPSDTTIEEKAEDEFDIPYHHENLEEDLKFLSEFGPVPYLLIGAGSASFAAYRAIRTKEPTAKVLMIGDEPFHPYMRPPLSKEMWFEKKSDTPLTLSFTQWNGKERSIFYEPEDYYFTIKELLDNKNGGVSVIRGKRVVKIDPISQVVFLDTGEQIAYEKCLLATGAKPKNLPIFEQAEESVKKHITLFRNIRDFQKLERTSKKIKSIVIVGGGFLGSELAIGLVKHGASVGLNVIQLFPESGNMGKVLPEYLSKWTTKKLQTEGVTVIPDVTIKAVTKKDKKVELHLSNDEVLLTDHIVVAVGAEPSTEIAQSSGLETDDKHGGFLVNAEMEARKNLWIAGDASCFYDIKLGRRRVEHHDHAVVSGRLAGENMTGSGKPYWYQSMFWSDLGPDIGYEAIGIVDSSLPTVGVFAKATEGDSPKSVVDATGESIRSETEEQAETKQPVSLEGQIPRAPESSDNYGKGVIFYLKDNIIVGIVLWNVFSKMSVARKIINESKSYDDLAEVAKLFELHSTEE